eukprot:TRINITY_DN1266_c0_g1_i2.p1 TRINITY_DN1266_c0_g1~~TRINITY_DN1266_c0_g1_i2.p1  ORF type:complete len:209 (+),score=61.64 TRINITY_DN1266_c0_g1_i2:50-676(+)
MDITLEEAVPTAAHMALAELLRRRTCAYLVSTNIDGLHRRSGIPATAISELHGNCYIEHCKKCKREYLRGYDVSNHHPSAAAAQRATGDIHATGAQCETPGCGGYLIDSIIHFGEPLPVVAAQVAVQESRKADVGVVLGTSMRVHPACDMPLLAKSLVICNLQKTPFDDQCAIRIWERTDKVMTSLMQLLGLPIPAFTPEDTKHQEQL